MIPHGCPCIVRISRCKETDHRYCRTEWYVIPTMELHDANEYDHFRNIVKMPCNNPTCGCRGNNLVDCIYQCPNGHIVGVEFKTEYKPGTKTTGCGVSARRILTIVVSVRVPPPDAPPNLLTITDLSQLCNTARLNHMLCT